jgi:prolipoprotein diacylglyceryl transferase
MAAMPLSELAAAGPLSLRPPPLRQISLGPLDIRLYALSILAGAGIATWIAWRRWTARGGDGDLVLEVALWSLLFGFVGGRLYHDVTSWDEVGRQWYGPLAIWQGGLGIWGGVAAGVLAGIVVVHRRGESITQMMDAVAPALLVGQAIGRLGNYFNQELFGGPTTLPWALEVEPAHRPEHYESFATFQPTFLYELLWNLSGAVLLVLLERRYRIRPPGLFCLYVAIYSLGRVFWEQLRVDPSKMYLGQRLNFYVALTLFLGALVAFVWVQARPKRWVGGEPAPSHPS